MVYLHDNGVARNVGLDLARILAILGVIALHVNGNGGILSASKPGTVTFWCAEYIEIVAFCSVDLFALISGYFGIGSCKKSTRRCIELVSISLVYSCAITVLFLLFYRDVMSIRTIAVGIFPFIKGRYWYLYCYLPLALVQPYFNAAINQLSVKTHKRLCCVFLIVFSLFPTIINIDTFGTNKGYSFFWLATCYFIGAFIKRNEQTYEKYETVKCFGLFVVLSLVLLIGNIFICYRIGTCINYGVEYTSPIVVFMAICLLLGLKNISFKNTDHKFIALMSQLSFDVYLLHAHVLIFDYILKDAFSGIAAMKPFVMILLVIVSVIIIYMSCFLIALLRKQLYRKINLPFLSLVSFLDKILYPS